MRTRTLPSPPTACPRKRSFRRRRSARGSLPLGGRHRCTCGWRSRVSRSLRSQASGIKATTRWTISCGTRPWMRRSCGSAGFRAEQSARTLHDPHPPPSHLPTVHLSITVPPSNTTSLVYDPDASFWVFFCLSRSRSHQPFEVARVTGGYERSLGGPRLQAERRCRVGIECVWREEPDGTEQQALRA